MLPILITIKGFQKKRPGLWCIFELAGYRKANPEGKIVFQPLMVERHFFVLWVCMYLVTCIFQFLNTGSARGAFLISAVVGSFGLIPGIHEIRRGFQEQERSLQNMAIFDLELVSCSSDFDKQFIVAAVSQWYGSADAFTQYVRGPLREELVQVVAEMQAPLSYCLLAVSPTAGTLVDVLGALWLAGAPSEVMLAFVLGQVLSSVLLTTAQLKLLFMLARHYAQPRFASRIMDYMQTVGVSLLFLMLLAVSFVRTYVYYTFGVPGAVACLLVIVIIFIAMFFRDLKHLWHQFRHGP